ncbi:hypothetical protein [Actinomadura rugatobispora]|uniref:Nucleotide exchange factor GrpE n=1 Tax=Actinomadura rugatobispora TaxID=1994 RepID=A0ABW1A7K4_9ACTN|nr:hypothetical protein GCM10010200_017440 [Actinomadura rugatobispora]
MGRVVSGAGAALRQWRHPREFRIHASAWPADALTALTELARAEAARAEAARAEAAAAALDRADAPPDTAVRSGPATVAGADTVPADTVTDLPVPAPGGAAADDDDDTGPGGLSGRSLADVATSLWRLRTRVDRMDDAPRAVVRHLETAWDALTDAGVEIKDHTGEPFDVGLAMSVVAYQPTPGLHREQIIETVRPGVYLGDHSIQMAEVIVGTPDPPPEAPAAGTTEETRTT